MKGFTWNVNALDASRETDRGGWLRHLHRYAVAGGLDVRVRRTALDRAESLSVLASGRIGISCRAHERALTRGHDAKDVADLMRDAPVASDSWASRVLDHALRFRNMSAVQALNLSEASYVVHFDRWSSPAVEDQATDRSHRAGQRHPATVYEYICAGTIEESVEEILAAGRVLFRSIGDGVATAHTPDDRERLAALVAALPDDLSVRGVLALAGEPCDQLPDLADRRLVEMRSLA